MKKFFLLAALVAGAQAVQAQSIAAGTVSLGGGIGYSTTTNKFGVGQNSHEAKSSQFSFSPTFGYFVAENVAIGLNLEIDTVTPFHSTGSSTTPDANVSLRIGPFVQFYKMFSEQFGLTGALGAGYLKLNETGFNSGQVYTTKASGAYAQITPGIVFFPIPKFALSATIGSLGYTTLSDDNDNITNRTTTAGAQFGLDKLQLGGTYYFGR